MKKWYFISPLLLQKLIWIPTKLLLTICGRIEVSGLSHLKNIPSNAIFACNHTSEFDVFMIPGSLPFFSRFSPFFYTSMEHKFYVNAGWRKHFYGGTFFKLWGAYPVGKGLHDYDLSLYRQVKILRDGGNLYYFPEGRITKDGMFQPARGGVAYLAHKTGLPIVPVYIGGAYQMKPLQLLFGKRKLVLRFGEPIYVKFDQGTTVTPEDYKRHAGFVMAGIQRLVLSPSEAA